MNYIQSIKYLFDHFPMYKKQGIFSYKSGLNRILKFCKYIDNPHHNFISIHIAGTNGKGSTAHMLSSIFQEAGYSVGLFSSPHLKDFRERIRYNGIMIPKNFVSNFITYHYKFIELIKLSFFEIITTMAFDYFRSIKVDIAIIETGLGGRLDPTNIILPEISIITNISYDHTKILGDTLDKIALEKAGIIKKNIPVIIGNCNPKVRSIFRSVAKKLSSPIFFAKKPLIKPIYSIPLKGNYQRFNEQIVIKSIEILRKKYWNISSKSLKDGLNNIIKNTCFRGRWEILSYSPIIICDIAHNEDGIKIISKQLSEFSFKKMRLILGFVQDKNIKKMLSFFPKDSIYYFSQPSLDRRFPIKKLKKLTQNLYKNAYYFNNVKIAFNQAKKDAHNKDLIFIGGSTFIVSDIL